MKPGNIETKQLYILQMSDMSIIEFIVVDLPRTMRAHSAHLTPARWRMGQIKVVL